MRYRAYLDHDRGSGPVLGSPQGAARRGAMGGCADRPAAEKGGDSGAPQREADCEWRGGPSASGAKRILICDDERRLATLTASLLEEHGFESLTAQVGDEALQLLTDSRQGIAMLLLDINLSAGLSAEALMDEIDQRRITVKVVLTSGMAPEDVPGQLMSRGCVAGYLPKPYSVERLVESVQAAIG